MSEKKKEEGSGAPAWVMTFADLMSLLMCFFVLLLSFSELDRKKYKQVAGSMKAAFGVQRDVPTQESPKGVTIIAQEFAPGKPQPTLQRILRQETTDDTQDFLEVLEAIDRVQEKIFGEERGLMKGNVDAETQDDEASTGTIAMARPATSDGKSKSDEDTTKDEMQPGKGDGESESENESDATLTAEDISEEAKAMEEALQKALDDARRQAEALRRVLSSEIDQELIEVDAKEQGVLIKVREQGSFPSAQATLRKDFIPVLRKIALALISESSEIVVGGHTDDLPISTGRFPSNWELAAGRASSVVQAFIAEQLLRRDRLEVRAFADTEPLAPNTTAENRARNRRVEIFINTMPDIADKAARQALGATATAPSETALPAGQEFEL